MIRLAGLALLLAFGTAVADDVEKEMQIRIVVAGDGEAMEFDWTSDDAGFSLGDLEVGESRTLENGDGEPVTVTRTEEGFAFDINGETVTVPDAGAHAPHMAFVDANGGVAAEPVFHGEYACNGYYHGYQYCDYMLHDVLCCICCGNNKQGSQVYGDSHKDCQKPRVKRGAKYFFLTFFPIRFLMRPTFFRSMQRA